MITSTLFLLYSMIEELNEEKERLIDEHANIILIMTEENIHL